MKTKEEIAKLSEVYSAEHMQIAFRKGYTQCQEDMKIVISEWQLCPMCIGEGVVQNVGTSSSIHRTCPVCNGNKTLIKPII